MTWIEALTEIFQASNLAFTQNHFKCGCAQGLDAGLLPQGNYAGSKTRPIQKPVGQLVLKAQHLRLSCLEFALVENSLRIEEC